VATIPAIIKPIYLAYSRVISLFDHERPHGAGSIWLYIISDYITSLLFHRSTGARIKIKFASDLLYNYRLFRDSIFKSFFHENLDRGLTEQHATMKLIVHWISFTDTLTRHARVCGVSLNVAWVVFPSTRTWMPSVARARQGRTARRHAAVYRVSS